MDWDNYSQEQRRAWRQNREYVRDYHIGRMMAEARKAVGLTQCEVSRRMHRLGMYVSDRQISDRENARVKITAGFLAMYCVAVGAEINEVSGKTIVEINSIEFGLLEGE